MIARRMMVLSAICLLCSPSFTAAGEPDRLSDEPPKPLLQRDTLTDNWFGLGRELEERGITLGLSVTQIYQNNVRGAASTHRHSGRYAGSWDLEFDVEPARLLKMPALAGGRIYLLAEGSWSNGIGDSSVGNIFGVNDDAGGDRSIDVTELWYEHQLMGGKVRLRIGKIDLTGGFECRGCPASFDCNAFANDETTRFLNGALVNNPTIPFPDNGLGVMLHVEPVEWLYFTAGVADANADARETGFNTIFTGDDRFLSIYEMGVTPRLPSPNGLLQGAYRVGFWMDSGPVERTDANGSERDNMGLYLSLDQMFFKETADVDDSQGLGVFFRCGFADSELNEIKAAYSAGMQYQGLIPGRDDDVLAVGFATGALSAQAGHTHNNETVVETYYNIQLAPWLHLAPSAQVVFNPGGERNVSDAVILGLRLQMQF